MSEPLKPRKIENIGVYGLIREAEVDSNLIPEGAVTDSMNFHFDRKGAATVRPGLTGLGSTVLASRPAVGLFNVQQATAIAVFSNGGSSTVYSFGTSSTPSAWAVSLDGGTASVKIRFVDFAGVTIMPNFAYNTLSSMRFWDGGTRNWKFTGTPINPQNMWGFNINLIEVYKSKVYATGDPANPSRLYFSSVITTTGNITWTPTTDFVDINPGDGEGHTGMKRYALELLLFKPNYIYRFKTSGVDPDPLIKVGTRSQESIVEGKRGLYFHNDNGFFRYAGGYPSEISRPISDIVAAIPFSQYDDIIGWNDADHIYWAIGNVTVNETKESITYKNTVVRYTESSDVWTIYSYSSDIRRAMTFNSVGTTLTRIVANDMGIVATQDSGVTDLGEMIKYRLRTKWYDWGEMGQRKIIQKLVALCEKAQDSQLRYRIDEELEWKPIGQLKQLTTFFDKRTIRYHRIKFELNGVSKFDGPVFMGIDIIDGINEGYVKELM